MEFFPRELCQKLMEMGCVSESGFYWYEFKDGRLLVGREVEDFYVEYEPKKLCQAFCQNDFTGCTERARENAKKRWGVVEYGGDFREAGPSETTELWILKRHAMIDHKGPAHEFVAMGLEDKDGSN